VYRVGIVVGYFGIVAACYVAPPEKPAERPRVIDPSSLVGVATPHGRYSLDNQDVVSMTIDGKNLPSCGVEAGALLAGIRPVEVVFDSGRVQVNGRDWPVPHRRRSPDAEWASGFGSADYVVALSPDSAGQVTIGLSFRRGSGSLPMESCSTCKPTRGSRSAWTLASSPVVTRVVDVGMPNERADEALRRDVPATRYQK
jgi:hypothetical protein